MAEIDRIEKLLALVLIAFTWSYFRTRDGSNLGGIPNSSALNLFIWSSTRAGGANAFRLRFNLDFANPMHHGVISTDLDNAFPVRCVRVD